MDLSQLRDHRLVMPTIASTLGVHDGQSRSVARSVETAVGDRELLLVLDNFEQVLLAAQDIGEQRSVQPNVLLVSPRVLDEGCLGFRELVEGDRVKDPSVVTRLCAPHSRVDRPGQFQDCGVEACVLVHSRMTAG